MDKNKIKVLFVVQALCGNGAVRTALNVLRHLDRKRFEVALYTIVKNGVCLSEVPADVKITAAHTKRRYNKYLIPYYLLQLLREASGCDIIVGAEDFRPIYLSYIAAGLLRKPVIGWNRTAIDRWMKKERPWHKSMVGLIYPRLSHIVCVSHAIVPGLLATAPINQKNIDVIYDSYEIDGIITKAEQEIPPWYEECLCKPTLTAAGRLSDEKGFDVLIKAHAKVLKKGIDHNLVIIGSGPFKNELRDLSISLGVNDSVYMPGYIDNPYPLLKKATAFVLSSHYEGFPAVVFEALLLGTPVVSTACGGPTEMITDGENGILVPPNDVNSLADGIYKVFSDNNLRAKFSKPDLEWLRRFSPENNVHHWEELLIEISRNEFKKNQN
jgi:glycosyltransferase involved in cell wall biosynthesis